MTNTALIMCGGKGSRFGNIDKSLVKYRDKSIIEYLFEPLKESGITKAVLICNEKNGKEIEKLTKNYFENYTILNNPPKRFREGIKHARKYLDEWFLLVAGNHPIESQHIISMKEKQKETNSWITTLYDKERSNEDVFTNQNGNLRLIFGDKFSMQHPLIISKEILEYQKNENFEFKIEETIQKLISKKNIYGILGNFPPEFDNKEMFMQNKAYLEKKLK